MDPRRQRDNFRDSRIFPRCSSSRRSRDCSFLFFLPFSIRGAADVPSQPPPLSPLLSVRRFYVLWVPNCGTSSILAMISSQSPSSYPAPKGLDGAVISGNGATKLREAAKPTDTFVNTRGKKEQDADRAEASLSAGVAAIKTTRVISQWRNFVLNSLFLSFSEPLRLVNSRARLLPRVRGTARVC